MNHTPLGKGYIFFVMWQMIQLQNSMILPDMTCHFQYQLCQLVLLRNRSHNWVKIARDILRKSIWEKNKKQRGQTGTSKESLQNVVEVWLLWKERRKARGLYRMGLTQERSFQKNLSSPHRSSFRKTAFSGVPCCLRSKALYTTHRLSSVQETGGLHSKLRHSWLWSNCTFFFNFLTFLNFTSFDKALKIFLILTQGHFSFTCLFILREEGGKRDRKRKRH